MTGRPSVPTTTRAPSGPRRTGVRLAPVAATAAALLAAGLVPVVAAAPASAATPDPDLASQYCHAVASASPSWGNTTADLAAGTVTIMGRTTTFDPEHVDLAVAPAAFSDPTRRLYWQSLLWAVPVYLAGPDVAPGLKAGIVEGLAEDPDPGSATADDLAAAVAAGWSEGTNTRREQVLNCLVPLTGDDALRASLEASVTANLDARRYYGPPYHRVHNHGTMANLALVDSSVVLARPELGVAAAQRLLAEIPALFDSGGFTREESAAYHMFNLSLWERTYAVLAALPAHPDLTPLAVLIRRARVVAAQLTSPLGRLATLGDGWPTTGAAPLPNQALWLTDGWGLLAGRWSWTDPSTTWFTVRLGLPRVAHGQYDHTSFTWSTWGTDVIVDPGSYSHDPTNLLASWQSSPGAHNLAVPAHPAVLDHGSRLVTRVRSGRRDTMRITSSMFTVPVTRTLVVDDALHRVTVTDTARTALTEHLHLAAGWRLTHRTTYTLFFRKGHRVAVVRALTRGVRLSVVTGSRSPVAGWVFGPAKEQATPAPQVLASGGHGVTLTVSVLRG